MKAPLPADFGLTEDDINRCESLLLSLKVQRSTFFKWWFFAAAVIAFIPFMMEPGVGGLLMWLFLCPGLAIGFPGMFGLLAVDSLFEKLRRKPHAWLIGEVEEFQAAQALYESWIERSRREFWELLSGREFEFEIAELFAKCGYSTSVTPASGDHGVDIELRRGSHFTIVQCKRYKNPIGPAAVRELFGALNHSSADDAILVCTGGFTSGVFEFVRGKPIRLMAMDDIIEMQQATSAE